MAKADLYNGRDPRDVPTYGLREAATYLRLPPTTLRQWVTDTARVVPLVSGRPPLLSFWNLVEIYVLAGLRRDQDVPLQPVNAEVASCDWMRRRPRQPTSRPTCSLSGSAEERPTHARALPCNGSRFSSTTLRVPR